MVIDSRLVEEAVLRAVDAQPPRERHRFHRDRDAAYECADADERERRFEAVHARWFTELRLGGPIVAALREYPELARRVAACRVVPAVSRRQEAADLFHDLDGLTLVVRLRPESLVDRAVLESMLRHELMHVADMLDPAFGYERDLPVSDQGPSYGNILRDRYRVVWDTTIDGRLFHGGRADARVRERRRAEFAAAFPMPDEEIETMFGRWFDEPRPTHEAIAAFIARPGGKRAERVFDGRCPICRFPCGALEGRVDRLPPAVIAALKGDHPGWDESQGMCRQCADLFEAHAALFGNRPPDRTAGVRDPSRPPAL